MNTSLALMAKAFKLNYSTPTNNNQRISSNPRNRQIAQPGMNMGQDRQMRMVGANFGNQFRQYAGQNVRYQNGYNAVQNVRNQVVQDAVQNQAARAEGNATGNNGNQIRCYNCRGLGHLARNCTVRPRRRDAAYLQTQLLIAQKEEAGIHLQAKKKKKRRQASTSGTQTDKAPVYDSERTGLEEQYTDLLEPIPEPHQVQQNDSNVISEISSVEQEGEHLELELRGLLRAVVSQDIMSIVQNPSVVDSSNLQTELDRTKERLENFSEQVDTTKGTSTNTKFANQSTERKPSLQPVRKNLVVRQPNAFQSEHTTSSKNRVPQKVDETNDLSKPVTSNSVPTPQESKIMKHDNVIAPGMFRINPFKPSREKVCPNKVKRALGQLQSPFHNLMSSLRKMVNSDLKWFNSTGVDNTA
ncbi:retrovirus-related pol polyprotein from transposon TNT 1-94 [Tanacetum coccineum]